MADPFAPYPSPQDQGVPPVAPQMPQTPGLYQGQPAPATPPQQTGFAGMSPSFWQNLMNFGANMSIAANARTPQGFLEYGNGFAGPFGAAAVQTEQQARDQANAAAQRQVSLAQAANLQSSTLLNQLHIPMLQAQINIYKQLGNMYGEDGMPPAMAGAAPNSPGAEGTGPVGNSISQIESGGDYSKVNKAGYSGAYQFGAAELAAAGLYTPAKGEDLSANRWAGTFDIPGYGSASYSQFMNSPQMQDAAFNVSQAYNWDQAKKARLDQYIGETVGGVPITQASLLGGMWLGGPSGMQKFLATGGQYNPQDSNGTSMSDYMTRTEQLMEGQGLGKTGLGGVANVSSGGSPSLPMISPAALQLGANGQALPPQGQQQAQAAPPPAQPQPLQTPQAQPQGNAPGQPDYHFMLPPGVPTVSQDQQLLQFYQKRAAMEGMVGLDAAASADNQMASHYEDMVKQAMTPQTLRGPGSAALIPGMGYVRVPQQTEVYGPGNTALPGVENLGIAFNGGFLSPPDVQAIPQGNVGANGRPSPQYITPGATGKGGPYTPGDTVTNDPFDAALLGLPYQPAARTNNQPLQTQPNPYIQENIEAGVKEMNDYQTDLTDQAEAAVGQNTVLQQMRHESTTWTPNNFAPIKNEVNRVANSIMQSFGIQNPQLNQEIGDYGSFIKNYGLLWQEQVRKVSSRASTQEAKMVGEAMPSATVGGNGLTQIFDELQGVNDYTVAKEKAFGVWKQSISNLTPQDTMDQLNASFGAQFDQRIRPVAFIINRMYQTPEGQQQVQILIHNLQQSKEGQAELASLKKQIAYGQQAGLFGNVTEMGP